MEAALATVAFRVPDSVGDALAPLLFAMDDFAGFRLVQTQARTILGNLATFTEGPLDESTDRQQPEMLAVWHRVPMAFPPEEWKRRARIGLAIMKPRGLEMGRTERVSLPSGNWLVLEGTGHDAGGPSIYMFQAVLFAATGYLSIVGLCRDEVRAVMAPRFRRAALSARLL